MSTYRRRPVALLLTALTLVALTGCGASEQVAPASTAAVGEGSTSYPVTLDNCGVQTTVAAAPQRVVSLDQDSTEILLSLGLEDRMVGTASWTDPVLATLAAANEKVPRLADNAPTYEVLLNANPDFVTASFGRHYAAEGVASRDRLAETGIGSYLAPSDCDNGVSVNGGTGTRTVPLTVDVLYQEIRELATVFDVQGRGDALIAQLQTRAAAATEGVDFHGRSVAFWFADTKVPYMAGGYNFASMLATTTGMTNVYSDRTADWAAEGWENLVAANPDILVLGDLQRDRFPGDRLADKTAFLESDPLTSTLPAVRDKRYIALHGAELNPSIRFVDALDKIRAWWDSNGATL
ncbi:ABC transporter substrate-binding protein [Rathayibacter iranicus]|uniref:ABC transporter substrate-binding protein n=2 Tax=Rathayibacter iranicus TaxID=59737 RepID=A0AAD1ADW6_9MICO|nr:ABC transporter substrate-binding protein [Rathayibacter iranicus]AZZ56462.1 ABC transporter substrate-binding protein [Rathayibacter iranicus]MWV31845.1 ABC transporter substrate-binding protein [Rathayibacter iranicus NCPPB 2253 = VKM Ac-1602]PPI44713.1 ABC transporter substrate-binding protein [Rathayibacter iranicus]PPI59144.1 ABC transporter substrate-binding protein [Rathayibacter iranicus]PPI70232.1 ABC transporter substrate-binding protein [Rathayibacter iranicus]